MISHDPYSYFGTLLSPVVFSVPDCDTPSNISGGYVVSDGLTAVYTCLSGYTLNGNMIRSCLLNGNGWDGANPSCSTFFILLSWYLK